MCYCDLFEMKSEDRHEKNVKGVTAIIEHDISEILFVL